MKLIKFSIPTCEPCKVLAEQMKKEGITSGGYSVQEVNLFEDEEQLGMKYGIRNVPVIVILEGEKEIGRVRNIEQLKEFFNNGFSIEGELEKLMDK